MAISNGDIIRVTNTGEWVDGNVGTNVFFFQYVLGDDSATYEEISNAMSGFLTTRVAPITTIAFTYRSIKVENLTNGLDLEEYAISIAGTVSGEYMPSFVSWAFRLYRGSKLTRNGRKSFAGVAEASVANGAPIAGAVTALNNLAAGILAGLSQTVGPTVDWTLVPVIVGRTLVGGTYEIDLGKINSVVDVRFERVSTQNTRKRYN